MMTAAIEVRNLHKSYGKTLALGGIDLTIQRGEFYGLLGPNGAGKTTTIGIITGLVKLQQGSVTVFGKDIIKDYRFTRSKIGLSPQEFGSDWFFPIEKLLIFQAGYYGIPPKKSVPRVHELLELFGLWEKRKVRIRQLSGGMKRRFQIVKALVHDPEILILDEPTAGVDVELRHMLWDYLKQLHRLGKTILLTTHYIEEAELLCERVSIIHKGFIVTEGSPAQLIKSLGKASIEVHLSGWNSSHAPLLSRFNFTYREDLQEGYLIFTVDEPEKKLTDIVGLLSKNGLHIREVKILKSSLEDVFVSLTGRAIGD